MAVGAITIDKNIIKKQGGLVVLGLQEYRQFLLYEIEKEQNDGLVREGLREERNGKTEEFGNFLKKQHPKLYANYIN